MRPLSLSEQEAMKEGGSDDLVCPACWDTENFTQVMKYRDGYLCPIHKCVIYALPMAVIERSPKHRGVYEQSLIDRRRSNMNKAIQSYKPSSIAVNEAEKADLVKRMNQSLILSGADLGRFKDAATQAIADMALVHGLNPFNGELWIIPKKGRVGDKMQIVGFTLAVGIKGLRRAARRISHFTINTKLSRVVSGSDNPEIIRAKGADICSLCNGVVGGECSECKGTGWWGDGQSRGCFKCGGNKEKKGSGVITCKRCDGEGRISPEGILLAEVYLDRHDVFESVINLNERARKSGMDTVIEYSPFVGEAVWQPGEQFPTRRTPAWVATKNASRDALNSAYELPFDLLAGPPSSHLPPSEGSIVGEAINEKDVVEAAGYTMEDVLSSEDDEDDEGFTLVEEKASPDSGDVGNTLSGQEFFDFKKEMQGLGQNALVQLQDVFNGQYNPSNTTRIVAHNLLAMVRGEHSKDKCRELTAKGEKWEL